MSRYDDIISLPHHVSRTHPHMPMADRAAQFSPFAALTGYEEVIGETQRTTLSCPQPDEQRLAELDAQLSLLLARQPARVRVTRFVPDERKEGGRYEITDGVIQKIDRTSRTLVLVGGERIPLERIVSLEGEGT